MDSGERTEAELALAWQAGEAGAFDAVYRAFAARLFGTAVALVGDRHAAGDVVHDTFLRAATRIGTLRDPARLRAWLFAILRNEATSWHRYPDPRSPRPRPRSPRPRAAPAPR